VNVSYKGLILQVILTAALLVGVGPAWSADVRIAVASNFIRSAKQLAKSFKQQTGYSVVLVSGSTGKLYAQIKNGAPYAAFFAADKKRPQLLEQQGVAIAGSRFTYAFGKIVLWSADKTRVDAKAKVLQQQTFQHLAIANPQLAPYGKAAREILQHLHLWAALQTKIVRGENIGQTFQFIKSGNAELGFVAYALIKQPGHGVKGSFWDVPETLYQPIKQQAVLLTDNPVARAFLAFVQSHRGREIIHHSGYGLP